MDLTKTTVVKDLDEQIDLPMAKEPTPPIFSFGASLPNDFDLPMAKESTPIIFNVSNTGRVTIPSDELVDPDLRKYIMSKKSPKKKEKLKISDVTNEDKGAAEAQAPALKD